MLSAADRDYHGASRSLGGDIGSNGAGPARPGRGSRPEAGEVGLHRARVVEPSEQLRRMPRRAVQVLGLQPVGDLSAIGRGKHTTRHVSLLEVGCAAFQPGHLSNMHCPVHRVPDMVRQPRLGLPRLWGVPLLVLLKCTPARCKVQAVPLKNRLDVGMFC